MPDFKKSNLIPLVSVIVPVYNDSESLKKCIQALEYQTYCKDYYEIIIVDNNSEENLELVVSQFPNIRYIKELKRGSYAARNKGLTIAKGDIIAFTDSDCIPAHDWLEKGASILQNNPNCGLVGGKIELYFQNEAKPTPIELYEKVSAFPQEKYVQERQFGVTANLFTRRSVLEQVGCFKSTLKSGGDREWGLRVSKAGYQLIYSQGVCVKHPARKSWSELHTKIVRQTSGMLDVASLNQKSDDRFATFLNWIAYLAPSPRITYLILTEPSINSLSKKVQTFLIMLLVKLFRGVELFRIIVKLRQKEY